MKVATKLALAFTVHVVLLGTVLVYHVRSSRAAVTAGYELTAISSRIYTTATEQLGRVAQLEDNAAKFWVTRDDGYLERFNELIRAHGAQHEQLAAGSLTPEERRALTALQLEWSRVTPLATRLADLAHDPTPAARDSVILLERRLDRVRSRTLELSQASQDALRARLAESAGSALRAERLSWVAAALALLLSVLISAVLVRFISESLHRLKQGTRQVAQGRFDYRLDTRRNDEFAGLARDFNAMTEQLAELDRMKRDFLSKVSHDLKTPLASIRETTGALLDEVPGGLNPQQRRLLVLTEQSAVRLTGMVAKLLDLSRFEAGVFQPELRTTDIAGLVDRAVEQCEAAYAELGLSIRVVRPDPPAFLECDRERMLQLLENLLENALKFSPPGGEIVVAARGLDSRPGEVPVECWNLVPARNGARRLLITVEDRGPGVPEDQKELIFERFYQVDPGRSARSGGVGLGLTICREIASVHGGTIWVADNPGGGSRFAALLPGTAPVHAEVVLAADERSGFGAGS